MPTAIPTAEPRLSPRQVARFLWLCIRVRYLFRRMERATLRVSRVGFDRAGGRLLYFAERWARLPRRGRCAAAVCRAARGGAGAPAVRAPRLGGGTLFRE
jgi:hypothetical protein